jgi:AcrR family transcriptional regulator
VNLPQLVDSHSDQEHDHFAVNLRTPAIVDNFHFVLHLDNVKIAYPTILTSSRYIAKILEVPKKYHHGELRQALLDAVDQLVRTKGPDAVTLRECARLAGVSHAAPLHHFKDYHALLSAYVAQQWILVAERMRVRRAAAGPDPNDALDAVGLAYIESGMRTPGLFGLLLRPDLCPRLGSEAFELGAKPAHEELVGAVKRCTGGSDRDEALAELAWSAVHGFVELQLLQRTVEWEEKAVAMLRSLRPVFRSDRGRTAPAGRGSENVEP